MSALWLLAAAAVVVSVVLGIAAKPPRHDRRVMPHR